MVKVETYIEITMKMSLAEARDLYAVLAGTFGDGAMAHYQALGAAIKDVEAVA